MFSVVWDYVVSLFFAWPGLLLGLLLSVDLLERTLKRRLLFPTHVKLIVAAVILVVGAITIRPGLSRRTAPVSSARKKPAIARLARPPPTMRSNENEESERRLKSEAESLKQELANERRR